MVVVSMMGLSNWGNVERMQPGDEFQIVQAPPLKEFLKYVIKLNCSTGGTNRSATVACLKSTFMH